MLGFIFLIGLVLGSFYNVVSLRTLSKESLSFPPSHCVTCNHQLKFWDLFPVLSYISLGGKCRYCKTKISPIYPFGELLTAIAYTTIVWKYGLTLEALIQIIFITFLIFATTSDLKEMIVPDRFVVIGSILVLLLRLIQDNIIENDVLTMFVLSGLASFGVLYLLLVLSKGKMGGADVKLYFLIGLAIGWNSFLSLFYASLFALAIHLPIIVKNKGKIEKGVEIPFVPFIILGVLATYYLDAAQLIAIINK